MFTFAKSHALFCYELQTLCPTFRGERSFQTAVEDSRPKEAHGVLANFGKNCRRKVKSKQTPGGVFGCLGSGYEVLPDALPVKSRLR